MRVHSLLLPREVRQARLFESKLLQLLTGCEVAVDLGCGTSPNNSYNAKRVIGFDLVANESTGVLPADLSADRIPLPDGSVDIVTAYDFLEHIPRWERRNERVVFPFVDLMSEIFRVLKPGGFFYSVTPCYPAKQAFQDPTHVNFISEDTFRHYFCGEAWATMYGFVGGFALEIQQWRSGHLRSVLRKPSDFD